MADPELRLRLAMRAIEKVLRRRIGDLGLEGVISVEVRLRYDGLQAPHRVSVSVETADKLASKG